jgi:hypothetical protein
VKPAYPLSLQDAFAYEYSDTNKLLTVSFKAKVMAGIFEIEKK